MSLWSWKSTTEVQNKPQNLGELICKWPFTHLRRRFFTCFENPAGSQFNIRCSSFLLLRINGCEDFCVGGELRGKVLYRDFLIRQLLFLVGGIYCDSHCNSHMRLWRREGTVSRTNNITGEMEYLKQLFVFFFFTPVFVVEQTSEIYASLREFKVAGTRNLWPLDGPKLAKLS